MNFHQFVIDYNIQSQTFPKLKNVISVMTPTPFSLNKFPHIESILIISDVNQEILMQENNYLYVKNVNQFYIPDIKFLNKFEALENAYVYKEDKWGKVVILNNVLSVNYHPNETNEFVTDFFLKLNFF
jgi:hypothetical protein